ncbi:hypothetical protein [Methylobacterium sp.]|uniref:capsular polysaccharide export protein, LipB/KpsS family n=1 Tax=Methylobacterium sp. TaxID=409 RepID=UPI003B5975D7
MYKNNTANGKKNGLLLKTNKDYLNRFAVVETERSYTKRPPPSGLIEPPGAISVWETPDWFNSNQPVIPHKNFYGYVPWIKEHGDALIALIEKKATSPILPISFIKDQSVDTQRRSAMRYAVDSPEQLRHLLFSRLTPLVGRLRAMIFSFDWHPFMRIISQACKDLDIPRILIPHESVFAKRDMYYVDATSGIDRPDADIVLGWGKLQKDIFVSRGYPQERIILLGAPKFDVYCNGTKPSLTRTQFCRIFNLDPSKPIILFPAQPLDSQFDVNVARDSQRTIMKDLCNICSKHNWQLIIRSPPSRASDVIGKQLREKIQNESFVRIDQSGFYRVTPFEALNHCDAHISVNSTMLFEALLLGKPSISARYIDFESFWQNTSIEFAHSEAELEKLLINYISKSHMPTRDLTWANEYLAPGAFDGGAAGRIGKQLDDIFIGKYPLSSYDSDKEYVMCRQKSGGNIAISNYGINSSQHRFIKKLLDADNVGEPRNASQAMNYDHFFKWNPDFKYDVPNFSVHFAAIGKRPIYIEKGFIGFYGYDDISAPPLSVFVDDMGPLNGHQNINRLHSILNSDYELTSSETDLVKQFIKVIVSNKFSSDLGAIQLDLNHLRTRDRGILLVYKGESTDTEESRSTRFEHFLEMVYNACRNEKDADILISFSPGVTDDASTDTVYSSIKWLLRLQDNIKIVPHRTNSYSMFEVADEVWTLSSIIGFEALLADKVVRCFSPTFYSGRSLTIDEPVLPHHPTERTVYEIFYAAYVMQSRYFNPSTGKKCSLPDFLDYLVDLREGTTELFGSSFVSECVWTADIRGLSHLSSDIYRDEAGDIFVPPSKTGHIIFGPYLKIGYGSFTLGYILDFSTNSDLNSETDEVDSLNRAKSNPEAHQPEVELVCDIVSDGSTMELAVARHSSVDVSDGRLNAKLSFKIPEGAEEGKDVIEFRISVVRGAAFKVKSVVIAKLR